MRMTYSPDIDALAVWFASGVETIGAKEIAPDTYADFDRNGRLLGIEILNASVRYDPEELEQLPRPPGEGERRDAPAS